MRNLHKSVATWSLSILHYYVLSLSPCVSQICMAETAAVRFALPLLIEFYCLYRDKDLTKKRIRECELCIFLFFLEKETCELYVYGSLLEYKLIFNDNQ